MNCAQRQHKGQEDMDQYFLHHVNSENRDQSPTCSNTGPCENGAVNIEPYEGNHGGGRGIHSHSTPAQQKAAIEK
eukprot:10932371-Karenia_brevis.AAC.1